MKFIKFGLLLFSLLFPSVLHAKQTITLTDKNYVLLRGQVDELSTAKVAAKILETEAKDVYVVINSPGGSVFAGLQLVDLLKGSGKKVHCVAIFAASMAFHIFEACDTRYVLHNSLLMQHVPSYSHEGAEPNNWSFAKLMHQMHDQLTSDEAARIGLSKDEFRAKARDDWWLFGEDAVNQKAADEEVNATCAPELVKKRTIEKVTSLFFSATVEWSDCPLISAPVKIDIAQTYQTTNIEELKKDLERLKMALNIYNMNSMKLPSQSLADKIKAINR